MAVNLISPTTLSGLLIGSPSTGSLTLTEVGGVPVSAAIEIQSSDGALLISRMTEAERDAMDVAPGMMIYNLDTGVFNFREGVAWHDITAGSVDGPGISTDLSVPVWNGTSGTHLKGTNVIIDDNDNLSGMETIDTTGGFNVDATANVTGVKSLSIVFEGEERSLIEEGARIVNASCVQGSFNGAAAVEGQITGFDVIKLGFGTLAAPALVFGQVNPVGIYGTGASINFAIGGLFQFSVTGNSSTVNSLRIGASVATNPPGLIAIGADTNIDVDLRPKGAASASIKGGGGSSASIKLYNTTGTFYTRFMGSNVGSNLAFVLPASDGPTIGGAGSTFTPLSTNGGGSLTFNNDVPSTARGTLTAAQMAAMYDTPVLLISSPGGTSTIIVHSLCLSFVRPGVATTGGGNIYAQYGNTPHGTNYATPATGIPASLLTGASAITEVDGVIGTGILPRASVINQALYLTNDTGVFAGGGISTLSWFCTFTVVPT